MGVIVEFLTLGASCTGKGVVVEVGAVGAALAIQSLVVEELSAFGARVRGIQLLTRFDQSENSVNACIIVDNPVRVGEIGIEVGFRSASSFGDIVVLINRAVEALKSLQVVKRVGTGNAGFTIEKWGFFRTKCLGKSHRVDLFAEIGKSAVIDLNVGLALQKSIHIRHQQRSEASQSLEVVVSSILASNTTLVIEERSGSRAGLSGYDLSIFSIDLSKGKVVDFNVIFSL